MTSKDKAIDSHRKLQFKDYHGQVEQFTPNIESKWQGSKRFNKYRLEPIHDLAYREIVNIDADAVAEEDASRSIQGID